MTKGETTAELLSKVLKTPEGKIFPAIGTKLIFWKQIFSCCPRENLEKLFYNSVAINGSVAIMKLIATELYRKKLRTHFETFGRITDCSLKYTKDGKFRRFAFVGFETDGDAQKARESLHNTFMEATRLTTEGGIVLGWNYIALVEECKPFGDETKPRAWSKYAKGSR
ncbi:RNA recognition domain-containing protein [Dirofilaria immitis]|nr:RNA recognition domain-containing protein [Dirofilaria immitis]